jgi:hypothetical protein
VTAFGCLHRARNGFALLYFCIVLGLDTVGGDVLFCCRSIN